MDALSGKRDALVPDAQFEFVFILRIRFISVKSQLGWWRAAISLCSHKNPRSKTNRALEAERQTQHTVQPLQLVYHSLKWVWMSDCLFQEVTEVVGAGCSTLDKVNCPFYFFSFKCSGHETVNGLKGFASGFLVRCESVLERKQVKASNAWCYGSALSFTFCIDCCSWTWRVKCLACWQSKPASVSSNHDLKYKKSTGNTGCSCGCS